MDISNLTLTNIIDMLFKKIAEMTNMVDLSKIDFANITGIIITTLVIIFTSSIILWLLKAIGLYTMAKNKQDKFAFLAFIPYACLYTEGSIVGPTKIFGIQIDHPELLLPLLLISTWLPFMGMISTILLVIFSLAILYRIYQRQVPNFAIILLIVSIILPILKPFILFFIRNNKPNESKN